MLGMEMFIIFNTVVKRIIEKQNYNFILSLRLIR